MYNIKCRSLTFLVLSFNVLMCNVATARHCMAEDKKMNVKPFNFKYFESLPEDKKVQEAQKEIERLFPKDSQATDFENYFILSNAKCNRGSDANGPFVACVYVTRGFSFVSTTWSVSAKLDTVNGTVSNIIVSRYLTGP